MAKSLQELVSVEAPLEVAFKAVGYKPPETKQQEKYLYDKAEAEISEAKGKTEAIEEFSKRKEELYARPDLQKQKIEAFAPTPESGSDLAKLFALTTAITFFGGGSGRYSGQAAMGNLAAAMDGYKKGRKDLFAQELKEYDKNMKSTMENNKLIEDKLKEYLDLATTDKDKAIVKLAEVKALTSRQGAAADIEKMTYEQLAKHAETIAKARAEWVKHTQEMQSKQADREAAAFEIYQDKDGNLVRVNKRTGELKPIADSQGLAKAGKPKTSESKAGGMDVALIQNYGLPKEEVSRLNPATTLPKTVATVSSAEITQSLADDIKKNKDAAGLALSFINKIDKYLPDRYNNADGESGVSFLKKAADAEIEGKDPDTVTEARKIAKKAVDVINARALAASGGSRILVSELRLQKEVIGLENLSPQSAVGVFEDLALRDIDKLKEYGFSEKTRNEQKAKLKQTPSEQAPTITTQQQYDALPPGSFYMEDGKRYQKPRSK